MFVLYLFSGRFNQLVSQDYLLRDWQGFVRPAVFSHGLIVKIDVDDFDFDVLVVILS